MTKEIYISSTPHETRLAVVEDDQLGEIYYERENEYTLAGSVYKGKVTRVLPGMQSAFVDIGLERDAFLYVTDFVEEQEDGEEYVSLTQGNGGGGRTSSSASSGRNAASAISSPCRPGQETQASTGGDQRESETGERLSSGGRRWRGRRGRGRGRGGPRQESSAAVEGAPPLADRNGQDRENGPANELAGEQEASGGGGLQERASTDERSTGHPSDASRSFRSRQAAEGAPHRERRRGETQPDSLPVLPGESLSKYGRGRDSSRSAEQRPERRERQEGSSSAEPVTADSGPAFRPSTMIVAPLDWDGSNLLPGESISRHKKDRRNAVSELPPAADQAPAEPVGEESLREEAAKPPSTGSSSLDDLERPESAGQALEQPSAAESSPEEPAEASASYRFDPSAPTPYRQSGTAEPAAEGGLAQAGVESTEEAGPQAEPEPEVHPVDSQDAPEVSDPAPDSSHAQEVDSFPSASAPAAPEFESADEWNHTPEAAASFGQHAPTFAPGEGQLEEETIDEEDGDQAPMQTHAADEDDDELVEETLDARMDSELIGEVVRDQHVDRRTGFARDPGNGEASNGETNEEPGAKNDPFHREADFDEEFAGAEQEEKIEIVPSSADFDEAAASNPDRSEARSASARAPYGRRSRGSRTGPGGDRRRMRRATAQTSSLPAIAELLKPNQEILVQIAKEPIARKGARITSHIALPGRFLVFMPTVNHVGVSRKISSDEERQRLKRVLLSEKGDASGGFIVRTAAASASEEDLRADIRFLIALWSEMRQRADGSRPPALIYHDLSLVERVLRDRVTEQFSAIWVDSEPDYERILRFLGRFEPGLVRRVKLYTKETPLFEQFGIQEEIDKALRSKVWLKSGGSIVINQTEALVAIDINTGKYVGKTARLEDTILKTNLDAIPEIVRQIRLRDLGGIIVIDFIDMDERRNRNKVMQALEEALKSDRAPSKVLQFNDFGLVAITRKRVRQSLERTLSVPCFTCGGTGMVKGPVTVCNEIYLELRKMHRHMDRGDILLRVNPEVVKQLKTSNGRWLSEMEEMSGKTIIVKSDAALPPEQFDIQRA